MLIQSMLCQIDNLKECFQSSGVHTVILIIWTPFYTHTCVQKYLSGSRSRSVRDWLFSSFLISIIQPLLYDRQLARHRVCKNNPPPLLLVAMTVADPNQIVSLNCAFIFPLLQLEINPLVCSLREEQFSRESLTNYCSLITQKEYFFLMSTLSFI